MHEYIGVQIEKDGAACIPLKCPKAGCKKPIHLLDLQNGGTNGEPTNPDQPIKGGCVNAT